MIKWITHVFLHLNTPCPYSTDMTWAKLCVETYDTKVDGKAFHSDNRKEPHEKRHDDKNNEFGERLGKDLQGATLAQILNHQTWIEYLLWHRTRGTRERGSQSIEILKIFTVQMIHSWGKRNGEWLIVQNRLPLTIGEQITDRSMAGEIRGLLLFVRGAPTALSVFRPESRNLTSGGVLISEVRFRECSRSVLLSLSPHCFIPSQILAAELWLIGWKSWIYAVIGWITAGNGEWQKVWWRLEESPLWIYKSTSALADFQPRSAPRIVLLPAIGDRHHVINCDL